MWSLCKDSWFSMCPKHCRCGIFFIKGIFTNVSTEMHSIFPDIVLTSTSFSTFLRQRLVVRRRRSAPPLPTARANTCSQSCASFIFLET